MFPLNVKGTVAAVVEVAAMVVLPDETVSVEFVLLELLNHVGKAERLVLATSVEYEGSALTLTEPLYVANE